KLQDHILVSSFAQENMDRFRAACPEVATSATKDEVRLFLQLTTFHLTRAYTPHYSCFQVPERAGRLEVMTADFIAAARERHLPILPWTINDENDLKHVINLGVEGINTDYPTRLLRTLSRKPTE